MENKICGIYKIENKVNGKIYIGQSVDIESRWTVHRNLLNKNKHDNSYLQNSWNMHGEKNFEFTIIKVCVKEKLNELELYYINKYSSNSRKFGYNLQGGGNSIFKMDEEIKEKISKAMKGNPKICGKNNSAYGKSVKERLSEEAYKDWIKKRKSTTGINKIYATRKKIICINTNLIFNTIKEAGDHYNVCKNSISLCCRNKRRFAGKMDDGTVLQWSFYEDGKEYKINESNNMRKNSRPIIQYDMSGNKISEYNSIKEAGRILGIERRLINGVCLGKRKTTHGYIFKYNIDN